MKKIVLILLILLTSGCMLNEDSILIKKYKMGTEDIIKELDITKLSEKRQIEKYINQIDILEPNEMVQLDLLKEIEILYNDDIRIYINLQNMMYCYYEDDSKNISSLAYLPNGFLNWINEKLK